MENDGGCLRAFALVSESFERPITQEGAPTEGRPYNHLPLE